MSRFVHRYGLDGGDRRLEFATINGGRWRREQISLAGDAAFRPRRLCFHAALRDGGAIILPSWGADVPDESAEQGLQLRRIRQSRLQVAQGRAARIRFLFASLNFRRFGSIIRQ
jgi:hypothetical protein